MPQLANDPSAFEELVEKVERDMRPTVERYRDGDGVRFPMKARIATAGRPR